MRLRGRRWKRSSRIAVAFASVMVATTVRADTPPPEPAPGQKVPAHAAGGWPTSTTDDDKKPTRTPEQQARLEAVTSELARIAKKHGPDSVVLQSKLLVRSMSSGALGATEVRVAGPSAVAGPGHLEIDVETGLFFDEAATTVESRRDKVWADVAAPVLDEMVSFHIEPPALELVFLFDVQSTAGRAESALDPTAPARHEGFRVKLGRPVLEDIIADELVADTVREKVEITPVVIAAPSLPAAE